jgi:L-rhamnose isomerase
MSSPDFAAAKDTYAAYGVDIETALTRLGEIPISLHCWQGDDVGGFEHAGGELTGSGLAATGNYPGKARSIGELRQDLDQAFALIPGKHRLNLHACYGDFQGKKIDRDAYTIAQFQSWVDWARPGGIGLDFNPTFFAHPLAQDGLTLSNPDAGIRQFWIEHGIACRKIGAEFGRQLGDPCVTNVWIPDGSKDTPADRKAPRVRLESALDALFAEPLDPKHNLDAVESKLFGLGAESYTVGSHEFYLGYAVKNQKLLCLDSGHFHPTETLADKVSSVLQFVPEILLHVSRGVRWDSDHVTTFDDATRSVMEELVRGDFLARTHIGLDYFDASINRIAAWVIGARSALKGLLCGLLEPTAKLREYELAGNFTARLALMEEARTLPVGAVWNEFCLRQDSPAGVAWLDDVKQYEQDVLSKRQ